MDIFKLGGNFLKLWENVLHEYKISLEYFQSCIHVYMSILLHYKGTQENSFVHIIPHKVFQLAFAEGSGFFNNILFCLMG